MSLIILSLYVLYNNISDKQFVRPFVSSEHAPLSRGHEQNLCEEYRGEYTTEVDIRIIVLTFNRSRSPSLCLQHIADTDTCGDQVAVDIWIDRAQDGRFDDKTLRVAREFAKTWNKGQACVRVQDRHAGIMGQWIDTWRPKVNTTELALIIEDDIDLSKHAYRWLRSVHRQYKSTEGVVGYTLQMENVNVVNGTNKALSAPSTEPVFLYKLLGTWGFAPVAKEWRKFQDWFHKTRSADPDYRPYVEGIRPNSWYRAFERQRKQDTMWEMWFIRYCVSNKMYTVYSNLMAYTDRQDVLLDANRREDGLHFTGSRRNNTDSLLLREWNSTFEHLPHKPKRYDFSGSQE